MTKRILSIFTAAILLAGTLSVGAIPSSDGAYAYELCEGGIRLLKTPEDVEHLTIPAEIDGKPVREIGTASIWSNQLKTLVLPEGVTKLEGGSIEFCRKLTSITLPESLIEMGAGALFDLDSLESIRLPSNLQILGESAFAGCQNLKTVQITSNLKSIGPYAFRPIPNVSVEGNPYLKIQKNALYTKDGKTLLAVLSGAKGKFTVPKTVKKIYPNAFSHAYGITELVLPSTLKSTTANLFTWAGESLKIKNGTQLKIPKSVQTIKFEAFHDTEMVVLTVPKTVKTVEKGAFWSSGLRVVKFEKGIKSIGAGAFLNTDLVSVTIPKGVKIGKKAFGYYFDENITESFQASYFTLKERCWRRKYTQIVGYKGSSAEKYAKKNKLKFIDIKTVKSLKTAKIKWPKKLNRKATGFDVSVTRKGAKLKQNQDFITHVSVNQKKGTLTAYIEGAGRYKGTRTKTYKLK